jgi:hypothetical protein
LEPLEPRIPWNPETVGHWYPGTLEPLKPENFQTLNSMRAARAACNKVNPKTSKP